MTNRELLLKALNNEEVERIPVGFWFHFIPDADKAQGLKRPEVIEKNIAGHKRFFDGFHPDFVKIMSDGYFGYPLDGEPGGTIADLDLFKPLREDDPWVLAQADLVKRVMALQADTMYFYNIFSPLTTLTYILGYEAVLAYFKSDPSRLAEALFRMARGIAFQVRAAIRGGGADGIYLSVQNPDIGQISAGDYHRYVGPADKLILDEANRAGENHILHICGYRGCKNQLESWKAYRVKAYNWAVNVEGVSLREGKAIFGGAAVIGGFANTEDSLLYRGTREEIEAFTEKLIAGSGRRGIILGADCTLPDDVALERFDWVRKKAGAAG
jgi:uroporphyrinogen decarboxylase